MVSIAPDSAETLLRAESRTGKYRLDSKIQIGLYYLKYGKVRSSKIGCSWGNFKAKGNDRSEARMRINGFGRRDQPISRSAMNDIDVQFVGPDNLALAPDVVYLPEFDSILDPAAADFGADDENPIAISRKFKCVPLRDPAELPWRMPGAECEVVSTSSFPDRDAANRHTAIGASRMVTPAPTKGNVSTFLMGAKEEEFGPHKDAIAPPANRTTNGLAPIVEAVLENFGWVGGLVAAVRAAEPARPPRGVNSPLSPDCQTPNLPIRTVRESLNT